MVKDKNEEKERIISTELDPHALSESALTLKNFLLTNIRGQDGAVKSIVDAYEVFKAGFNDPDRPIYAALLCGPSGVGKTLIAELMAEFFHGHRAALTRISCEAYSESHAIARLVGSPPGYVGFWRPGNESSGSEPILSQDSIDGKGGEEQAQTVAIRKEMDEKARKIEEWRDDIIALTYYNFIGHVDDKGFDKAPNDFVRESLLKAKIEKNWERIPHLFEQIDKAVEQMESLEKKLAKIPAVSPVSIILFDEIEKANPTLHNILLNIMDKGTLQLANGMTTSFKNSIIVMTSNASSRAVADAMTVQKKIGFDSGPVLKKNKQNVERDIYKASMDALHKLFAPEFLGRFDRISLFSQLSPETMGEIFDLELRRFVERHLSPKGIDLCITQGVRDFIVKEATDNPRYGARLLKTKILKYLKRQLCRIQNRGELEAGDTVRLELAAEEEPRLVFFRDRCASKSASKALVKVKK